MTGYRVVYDVTQSSPDWFFPAGGLVMFCIGLAVLIIRRGHTKHRRFLYFWTGFTGLWTLVAGFATFGGDVSAREALRSGHAKVVEGVVEDFHPMPPAGHDTERFTVQGVPFKYSDFILTPGFHNTSSHGGPVRAGLHVRIHYDGTRNDILKLEIEASED